MDVVSRRISLTAWGRLDGFDKATTARRHHAGRLLPALRIERLPNRRYHGVVPSAQEGCRPNGVGKEIGSGPDGHRLRWRRPVADPTVGTIVVKHRARVTRFGFEHVEAALAGRRARLPVMAEDEPVDDLVGDAIEVPTSLCARRYGRRSALRRAERALASAQAG